MKRGLWKVIVMSGLGGETDFRFRYVPQVSTITEMGKVDLKRKVKGWEKTEWRNIRALMILGAVVSVGVMGCVKVGLWILGVVMGMI